ncbi:LysR family transcriptional regulator [Vreelandella maris]|uniref:LysR family transcriptional regulator n=1 Tax=Vreelandella maris TaxID=2729617 RepID=A0A7Y6RF43_9GAMM|nr:LysR family transcriptional regulator [Halomonas maris]NVF15802.1 LysR family transcriptional regulator [Halomonas maris]|tara:strand:- start:10443 stop:11384 length:942 start_codon:yes stop_codon:yes gene_type:complete
MTRRIPSTTALIAFEATARMGTLSRAASELCLTESAVSKQVSKLEDYLALKLFDRFHGRVTLSEAGKNYFIEVRKTLDKLEADTQSVINFHQGRKELRLAVLPTFSNKWLLPRLKSLSNSNLDIIVNISGRPDPFVFEESEFDAAIHFDHPNWTGCQKHTLFSEDLIAILNPSYFDGKDFEKNINKFPLLHKSSRDDAWKRWLSQTNIQHSSQTSGPRYDSFANVIEAVRSGMGVALVPKLYVAHELESGELFQCSSHVLRNEKTYILILPEREQLSVSLQMFVEWVKKEAHFFNLQRNKLEADTYPTNTIAM